MIKVVNSNLDRILKTSNPPVFPHHVVENSGWSPYDIDTWVWLDSSKSSTITESGGLVSQWRDVKDATNYASQSTAASQPTKVTNGINFQSDFLTHNNAFPSGALSLIMALKTNVAEANVVYYGQSGTTTRSYLAITTGSYFSAGAGWTSFGTAPSTVQSSIGKQVVHACTFNDPATEFKIYIDGVEDGGALTGGSFGGQIASIGSFSTGSYAAVDTDIYEIIVTESVMDDDEMETVSNYLSNKWF